MKASFLFMSIFSSSHISSLIYFFHSLFKFATELSNSLEQQKEALRLLVYLLPIAHRDTLRALLSFLRTVAAHSADVIDADGHEVRIN